MYLIDSKKFACTYVQYILTAKYIYTEAVFFYSGKKATGIYLSCLIY